MVFSEVWSQKSPYGESYEFKVNCISQFSKLEDCFLWDVDSVKVISPNRTVYLLKKDFNINNYSGEITRRWVLYGPMNATLPESGDYIFQFIKNKSILMSENVSYVKSKIGYPKNVNLKREGSNINIEWNNPDNIPDDVFYKVIVWNEFDTPSLFISQRFDGKISNSTLKNVPLQDGGNYSLNVALYFKNGYSFSEYNIFTWK